MNEERIHHQACNLCEAICGLEITTRGEEIVSIKGDKNDPLSQGHICPKAIALQDLYKDSERLREPVRRNGDAWETISWDEAFTQVVNQIKKVQADYGNDAVGTYQGNPSIHSLGIMLFARNFLRQINSRNRYSATSVDQLPHHVAAGLMFGHSMLLPVPDIDRCDYMIILGANPLVSNGSIMTVPNVGNRLKALQARGGKFCVIDPRKTETAALADEHFFVKPGSDAHLLAAMITTVFEEGLFAPGKLAQHIIGLDKIEALCAAWRPENVETQCGIPAMEIRRMVREFCAADSAALYGRMGVSTQEFGSLCQWLIIVFNTITGNLDKEGGAMFAQPAVDFLKQAGAKGKSAFSFGGYHSRVKKLPEMQGELPVTTLADELLTEGEGQIKAMVVIAGNPVLSTPNGQRVSQAFSQLDFMVAIDSYINETTRHADIILPPATILERTHYDIIFHALAVRNTARYSEALFSKSPNQYNDAEIFLELAMRMQKHSPSLNVLDKLKLRYLKKHAAAFWLNHQLKRGPYGKSHGLTLKRLRAAKNGIDLGPLQPCLPQRLFHQDKKIRIAPEEITRDLPRLHRDLISSEQEKSRKESLLLIGRRDPRTCNSWLHNSKRMTKGKARCVAHIHPHDAKKHQLNTGQYVRVHSATGSIELEVLVTTDIKQGVISIPHGWGHNLPGVKMSCAVEHAGVSVNDLTDNSFFDRLSGNAVLNGVPVTIEAVLSTTQSFLAIG